MRIILFLIGGLIQLLQADNNQLLCEPYAPRLSLGYYYTDQQNSSDMIDISFNTNYSCPNAFIKVWQNIPQSSNITYSIGISDLLNMSAIYTNYSYPYNYTYFTYIQTVQLGDLIEGQLYHYEIYGNASLKPLGPFNFRPPFRNTPKQQKIIFFGDMDTNWLGPNASGPTLDWFQNQIAQNVTKYDLALFSGDMAYDLEGENCNRGDFWLRNISLFTKYIPVLVMPGNHDKGNNTQFPMVRKMFRSPEKAELNTQKSYYNFFNWNLGLAHFITFNPFWILYNISTQEQRTIIYNQLEQDLITANKSRDQVPWLIITSHYPMYCSDSTNPQCGTNWLTLQNYTKLFTKFKVDMYIAAHQHDYERDKPTIDNVTAEYASADSGHTIINSTAPLYIVDGSAGNNYYMPPKIYTNQSFTQEQFVNVSIGILTIQNRTHLYWEQRDSASNQILDYVFLIKPDFQVNGNSNPSDPSENQWWFVLLMIVISLCIVAGVVTIALNFWRKGQYYKAYVQDTKEVDLNSLHPGSQA